jgi:hypothetical protein
MIGPPTVNLVFQIWFSQSNDRGESVNAIFLANTTAQEGARARNEFAARRLGMGQKLWKTHERGETIEQAA